MIIKGDQNIFKIMIYKYITIKEKNINTLKYDKFINQIDYVIKYINTRNQKLNYYSIK